MLPPNIQVSDLKWISIWCREFSKSFGDFIIKGYQNSVAPELGRYSFIQLIQKMKNLNHNLVQTKH